ncbi:NUDIX domain-containing protein [Streptomyces xanthophaeus]
MPVHRTPQGEVSVVMHHRAAGTDQGETWILLAGARDSHESAAQAAVREAVVESDSDAAGLHVERVVRDDYGGWSYDTVIAFLDRQLPARTIEGESLGLAWVRSVPGLYLPPRTSSELPTPTMTRPADKALLAATRAAPRPGWVGGGPNVAAGPRVWWARGGGPSPPPERRPRRG